MTNMFNALLAGTALALMGTPALADVKSGVEAWDKRPIYSRSEGVASIGRQW